MRFLSRLVWSEGMYLSPQHFQAQNRYFEDSVHFALGSLCFAPFGLISIAMDPEAIRNGIVALTDGKGIFPDGLCFDLRGAGSAPPFGDMAPAARAMRDHFPPALGRMTIFLAVPSRRQSGINCSLEDSLETRGAARYRATEVSLLDEVAGRDEHRIRLGTKNLQFLFEGESLEGFETLPVACVLRDGSGGLVFDPKFVPPCVCVRASHRLRQMLHALIEIIQEKAAVVAPDTKRSGFHAGMSSGDVASFWFLHTLRSSLPSLIHIAQDERCHPEELFRAMSQLAGALCTFGVDSHPRSLPAYEHLQLERCFAQVEDHIRTHLEFVIPSQTIEIPLAKRETGFYEGAVTDSRVLGRANWVLGLHAAAGEADILRDAPRLLKLCSGAFVARLVERALPGLVLTHLPVPPSAISPRVSTQYFSVSRSGPCWDHILLTKRVGLYIPNDFPSPEVELLAVIEN